MAYFERLWSELPDAVPERFERRRGFLLATLGPGARVLDVGCGSGWFCEALAGDVDADRRETGAGQRLAEPAAGAADVEDPRPRCERGEQKRAPALETLGHRVGKLAPEALEIGHGRVGNLFLRRRVPMYSGASTRLGGRRSGCSQPRENPPA